MVGIQIGKEQEERKREEEGLNFETTPWWNFITIMGYADEELRSASLLKFRAQPTAKAKAMHHMEGVYASYGGGLCIIWERELTPSFHQF
jgi:hypothetical protein